MEHPEKMSLKAFWETVEQRLAACSADDFRAILRAMAHETPPAGRRDFVARLVPAPETALAAPPAIPREDLLADIADLDRELADAAEHADEWEERYEWGEYAEEDSLGPYEEFVEPLTGLFDRAAAAFDYGDLALARAAYRKLFDLLGIEDDYGRGVRSADLPDVDRDEAAARYLRAVYETAAPARRPQALCEEMRQLSAHLADYRPRLEHMMQISPRLLPYWAQFLEDWIAFLQTQSAPSGSDADAWLREAVWLARGTPGLAALAQTAGRTRPRAYLDWFTALEQAGRYQEVLTAAQEALQTLPAQLPIRAAIADHLCAAAGRLHETSILRQGRWEAFTAKPTLPRLLDLWESTPDATGRGVLLQQATRHLEDYLTRQTGPEIAVAWDSDRIERPAPVSSSVLAHAYMLAGDWEAALRLAAPGKVLGWSSGENVPGLVVAACLVLLSGKLPDPLPPNLTQIWQWGLQYSTTSWGETDPALPRLERVYAEHLALVRLSAAQQERLLAWALEVMQQRVAAIVGSQHRRSYDKAAVLVAACAEVLRLRGQPAAASKLVNDVRERFPRHRAFQLELQTALRQVERDPR